MQISRIERGESWLIEDEEIATLGTGAGIVLIGLHLIMMSSKNGQTTIYATNVRLSKERALAAANMAP